MGVSQVSSLYLLGFCLLFAGVFSKPSLIQSKDLAKEHSTDVVIAKPNSKVLATNRNFYGGYRANIIRFGGFTGFRSVFQWTVGTRNVRNFGIRNGVEFTVNSGGKQLLGDIGIFNNGSQIGVPFSLYSLDSSSFNCSKNFPYNFPNRGCLNSNFTLISNAIYYLDVEINNKKISGYISQPQTTLSNINSTNVPRILIGEINVSNQLTDLIPENYWIINDKMSCNNSSEISTFNYLPEQYNRTLRQKAKYSSTELDVNSMCGPLNTLAMTDWSTVVFISRPTPVINGTSSMNS